MSDAVIDFVPGDATGLAIPAHPDALVGAGTAFLTAAFRAFGSLAADNEVTRIAAMVPCGGGSTGAKLFATLDYARAEPGLPRDLFIKFSRDFADARRDRQRDEMAGEARFSALARVPGFPIAVPQPVFADYHAATGTGIVITERIFFGEGDIEPHRRKCLDHETLDDPLPYYRATVTALARLAGAHKAGRLGGDVDRIFPLDLVAASSDPIRYDAAGLAAVLAEGVAFAARAPQLLPSGVRTPAFQARLAREAELVRAHAAALQRYLRGNRDLIALCHWNAHIDNAFFWRDPQGLRCGLIDWGRVGQISFGSALWGGLSAAHHAIWDDHLDALLSLFAAEYLGAGGPAVAVEELRLHLLLHVASMGIARVLAFPEVVLFRLPEAVAASGPQDPVFRGSDPARNSLHVYTVFLKLWQRSDVAGAIAQVLARG